MTDELKKEWISVVECSDVYLYGAKKMAEKLYTLISILGKGYKNQIKGFLVTDGKENVQELCGLPVHDVHVFQDKSVRILVPHMGIYKEQIVDTLNLLGFYNVFSVCKLLERTLQEEREAIDNIKVGWETYNKKAEIDKLRDISIREKIIDILQKGQPDFGGIKPYQSLELIGLDGIRPTEYRIREYGLREILNAKHNVLDIGCNSGFLDIAISDLVQSVTGIEYDENLVNVANVVKDYLKALNCTFYQGDFVNWYKNTNIHYNAIFSFAVHHWLDISSKEYVVMIDKLLAMEGYLWFESHVYKEDFEYHECCKEFEKLNYRRLFEKKIKDDGIQEREFVLFQKRR